MTTLIVTSPLRRLWSIVMSMSVCLCVHSCNSKSTRPNFTNLLRMLPVTVASSSSDGVAICYILTVLWMTSCFHTMGPVVRIKHDVMFRRVHQVVVPVGSQTTTVFGWSECSTGSEGCYLQLPCCCCRQLSLGGAEPVRVPFALPPSSQNEAQLQFLVNSIAMPQKLKGTLTYIAKVTYPTMRLTGYNYPHWQ